MENEIWRRIPSFKHYEVSSLGRVKSLKKSEESIMKPSLNNKGYWRLNLMKNNKMCYFLVHRLVAMAFLSHELDGEVVVDHIDNNPLNNNVENLQFISKRENCIKDRTNNSSRYPGVCWHKAANKWMANIRIDGKVKYLGLYEIEEEAFDAYMNALKDINELLYNKYSVKIY